MLDSPPSMEITALLYERGAIKIDIENQFQWSSGIHSPIYCDNRITIFSPWVRQKISQAYIDILSQYFPTVNLVAGVATGGIPYATLMAHMMQLNMVYVRPESKKYGMKKQIEGWQGVETKPCKAIVVEDLISTGRSVLNTIDVLEREKIEVLGVIALFSYKLKQAETVFAKRNIKYVTISHYPMLKQFLLQEKKINEKQERKMDLWYESIQNIKKPK